MTAAPLSPERLAEIEASHQRQANALAVDHPVDLQERCDHHAIGELLAEVRRLQSAVERARTYSPFSPEPCPLCTYEDGRHTVPCAMHARIDEMSATIKRLAKERDSAIAEVGRLRRVALDIEAQRHATAQREIELELETGLRIIALKDGLREACRYIDPAYCDDGTATSTKGRLLAIADGVQKQ